MDGDKNDKIDVSTVPFWMECMPTSLIQLACTLHASAVSLVEIRDILSWFGVDRSCPAIRNWCHSFTESHEQMLTAEPDRVTVDENRCSWLKSATSGFLQELISA